MRFYDNALLRHALLNHVAQKRIVPEAHCPRYENVRNDSVKLFLESLFLPVTDQMPWGNESLRRDHTQSPP